MSGKYDTLIGYTRSGFSHWTAICSRLRRACCDCGLVHDEEFQVLYEGKPLDMRKVRLLTRVRRNEAESLKQREWEDAE